MHNSEFNLSEFSDSYYQQANIYKIFSQAEDYPAMVYQYLKKEIEQQDVLDLGCGNGKYSHLFSTCSKSIISADLSYSQLEQFDVLTETRVQLDGRVLPFANSIFDRILACWMLGTIMDLQGRLEALNEMKRTIKPGGKIFLVENAPDSEFEILRGRHSSSDTRTAEYNNWLEAQGFKSEIILASFFQFKSMQEAQYVFKKIWGNRLTSMNIDSVIKHDIIIYSYSRHN